MSNASLTRTLGTCSPPKTAVETTAGMPLPIMAVTRWTISSTRQFVGGPIAEAERLRKPLGGLCTSLSLGDGLSLQQHSCPEFVVSFFKDVTLGSRLCQVIGSERVAHNRSASINPPEGLRNAPPVIQNSIARDQESVSLGLPSMWRRSLYPSLYHKKRRNSGGREEENASFHQFLKYLGVSWFADCWCGREDSNLHEL